MTSRSVLVAGAGIAGLTAAHRLSKLGVDVTVLEASRRVGGRMSTERRDGYLIDRGAQFLSDGYCVICDLIAEMGLGQHVARVGGCTGIVRGGAVRRTNAGSPWSVATSGLLGWRDTVRVARASLSLVRATRHLPLNDYSKWHTLDDADAADWIAASFGKNALEYVFEPMLEGFYFQAPEQMSRAWPAVVWSFGARRRRATALVGGIGGLPEALAQKLKVCLAMPVEAIDTAGSGVSVRTPAGTLHADHLVLATPAPVARQLYAPELDVENRLLATGYSAAMNISLAVPEGVSTTNVPKDIYGLLIPRQEREVIAAVGVESRKCHRYVPQGELLNVMLAGAAAARLMQAPQGQVLAEVLPELQRYFPGIDRRIAFVHFSRWAQAEPRSPVGRSRDLQQYRQLWHPGMKVVLAGDYMSIPCTEGAAESGQWAATALVERTVRRAGNLEAA